MNCLFSNICRIIWMKGVTKSLAVRFSGVGTPFYKGESLEIWVHQLCMHDCSGEGVRQMFGMRLSRIGTKFYYWTKPWNFGELKKNRKNSEKLRKMKVLSDFWKSFMRILRKNFFSRDNQNFIWNQNFNS